MSRHPESHDKAKKEAEVKAQSQGEDAEWRIAWKKLLEHLSTSWIPNLVVGLVTLLIGPIVGWIMKSQKYTVYGAALGFTILVWVVAVLFARKLDEASTLPAAETPSATPVSRTGPRLREGLSQIFLSLGGATFSMPIPQVPFPRQPIQLAGFAPSLFVDPVTRNLYIDVTVADPAGGAPLIEVRNNEFVVNRPDWDRNFNENALEVVNSRGEAIFQLIYRAPNYVVLNGIFPTKSGYIVADDSGMSSVSAVPTTFALRRLFRYPSWKYPGQLQ